MSARHFPRAYDALAQRWCDLAERRRDHFIELYRSGRWRHYYDESEFIAVMRGVIRDAERWAEIAGRRSPLREAAE